MTKLKAVISQNAYGNYEIQIERDIGPGYMPSVVDEPGCWACTYTLKGARKKAVKMLEKARRARETSEFREEVR